MPSDVYTTFINFDFNKFDTLLFSSFRVFSLGDYMIKLDRFLAFIKLPIALAAIFFWFAFIFK